MQFLCIRWRVFWFRCWCGWGCFRIGVSPTRGVICRYRKPWEIENKEWDQYKEAVRILSEELTTTIAKLKEESYLREEAEKAKVDLATELTTLRMQVDKAKADATLWYRRSEETTSLVMSLMTFPIQLSKRWRTTGWSLPNLLLKALLPLLSRLLWIHLLRVGKVLWTRLPWMSLRLCFLIFNLYLSILSHFLDNGECPFWFWALM